MINKRETEENLRVRFPTDRKPYANDYEYEDDSDLEEDDEDIVDDEPAPGAPQVVAEKTGDDTDVINIESSGAKDSEHSDITSVSDSDCLAPGPPGPKDEAGNAHIGKVVVIEDVAFVT